MSINYYLEYFGTLSQEESSQRWISTTFKNWIEKNPTHDQGVIEHVLDWMSSEKPKTLRLSVEQAIKKSDSWLKKLAKLGGKIQEVEGIDIETVLSLDDGYKWVRLISESSFKREGNLMSHCVASYYGRDVEIYSLRDGFNNPHCTIQKDSQIQGKGNGAITEKYIKYVISFLEWSGMKIDNYYLSKLGLVPIPENQIYHYRIQKEYPQTIIIKGKSYYFISDFIDEPLDNFNTFLDSNHPVTQLIIEKHNLICDSSIQNCMLKNKTSYFGDYWADEITQKDVKKEYKDIFIFNQKIKKLNYVLSDRNQRYMPYISNDRYFVDNIYEHKKNIEKDEEENDDYTSASHFFLTSMDRNFNQTPSCIKKCKTLPENYDFAYLYMSGTENTFIGYYVKDRTVTYFMTQYPTYHDWSSTSNNSEKIITKKCSYNFLTFEGYNFLTFEERRKRNFKNN